MAALLVVVTVATRGRLSDPDMWWHLKAGERIVQTGTVPHSDEFSYTAAGRTWIAQEWLAEVSIYGAYRAGGYSGLMGWLLIASTVLVLSGFLLCTLYSGNVKIGFLGGLVIWVFSTVGLAVRPHMLGFLLFDCELLILQMGKEKNARWFYALPPLFALWINLHSSFIFGLAVLAVMIGCSFAEFTFGAVTAQRWPWRTTKTLLWCTGVSILALLVNPIGAKLLWYPVEVMLHQPLNLGFIAEWQQPDFGSVRGVILLGGAAVIILVLLLRSVRIRLEELLLVGVLFYFAIRHVRMEFLFGIVAAPILCRLLADAWDRYAPERDRIAPNAFLIAVAAVATVVAFPSSHTLAEQVERANPVQALAFIRQAGLSGRLLNDYAYGGYLIWAAPERRVFIDGRADLYEPAGVLADYMRFMSLDADPQLLLTKYDIGYCLFSRDQPIVHVMPLLPGWSQVYSDEQAVVFARRP